MPTLHVYLVGINEYAGNIRNLQGCVGDIELLDGYFEQLAKQQKWTYRSLLLRNSEATRQGITDGFAHFKAAKDGDFCVWAYSGHGTRLPAPPVFWPREPDKQHEAIVCYDSGLPGGRYLLDKENAWLLWQATRGKDVHCLVLTDCCHAGTNLRLAHSNVRYHRHSSQAVPPQLSDYLGVADYIIDGEYRPTTGRFVQFAACRADQVSIEQEYLGGYHGVFTYELLKTLHQTQHPLTYPELWQSLRQRMSSRVKNQSPQLDFSVPELRNQVFLSQQFLGGVAGTPKVYVSQDHNAWLLNLGALHGVQKNTSGRAEVWLPELEMEVWIKKVHADYSILELFGAADPRAVYRAEINSAGVSVAFAPGFPFKGRATVLQAYHKLPAPNYINWHEDAAQADYWVELLNQEELRLVCKDGLRICFKPVTLKLAGLFLRRVSQVGKWEYLHRLQNINSNLPAGTLHFEWMTYAPEEDFSTAAPKQVVDWPSVAQLSYDYKQHQRNIFPAFSLAIENTSGRSLFISLLFLANDYSISNSLLPNQKLNPGERIQLSHRLPEGQEETYIRVAVENCLIDSGVDYAPERLKVIASDSELSTEDFNTEEGLCPSPNRSNRSPNPEEQELPDFTFAPSWRTYDLDLVTCLEAVWKPLPSIRYNHQLTAIGTPLTAKLLSLEVVSKRVSTPFWWPDSKLAILPKMAYEWTPGFNRANGLSVLALVPTHTASLVEGIVVQFPAKVDTSSLHPCKLSVDGALSKLPHRWKDNTTTIDLGASEQVQIEVGNPEEVLILFYYFNEVETAA